jgi:hypothetical protein
VAAEASAGSAIRRSRMYDKDAKERTGEVKSWRERTVTEVEVEVEGGREG